MRVFYKLAIKKIKYKKFHLKSINVLYYSFFHKEVWQKSNLIEDWEWEISFK